MRKPRVNEDMTNWSFKKSTFCREIRRVNRNRIILTLIVLAALLYVDTLSTAYKLVTYKQGPQEVTEAAIDAITEPKTQLQSFGFSANHEESSEFKTNASLKRLMLAANGSCYLAFTPSLPLEESNVPAYTKSGESADVEYMLCRLPSGKLMLVKRSSVLRTDRLKGTIGYLPSDLRATVLESRPDLTSEDLAPLIMDATGETFDSLSSETVFSCFMLLIWGLWFFFVVRRACSIERDPAYRRIFTCFGSVEDNARSIDDELQSVDCYTSRGTTVTESWRLTRRLFSFMAEPKEK